jgi:hypothetical protein
VLGVTPWVDPTQWTHRDWAELRDWLAALGTVAAVLVALYVGVWRSWRQRPSLSLIFDDSIGLTDLTEITTQGGTLAGYVRFRVQAKKGKRAAEDVEVLVLSVKEATLGQTWKMIGAVENWPLVWSNVFPPTTKVNLAPGVARHVDLLHIYKDGREGALPLILDIYPMPTDDRHVLPPSAWLIRLALTARNADASIWETYVEFGGKWGSSFRAQLTVTPPTRIKNP